MKDNLHLIHEMFRCIDSPAVVDMWKKDYISFYVRYRLVAAALLCECAMYGTYDTVA